MKQIVVDITILSDEYMKEHNLYCRYRIKTYCYNTGKLNSFGVKEEDIQDYFIGKIIRYSI